MPIRIYHNPRCSKSRQTLKLLQDAGADVEIVEYLKTPLDARDLGDLLQRLDMRGTDLLRKGEAAYKTLGLHPDSSDEEAIAAMVEHPILMERPVVVAGSRAVVARPPERALKLLQEA